MPVSEFSKYQRHLNVMHEAVFGFTSTVEEYDVETGSSAEGEGGKTIQKSFSRPAPKKKRNKTHYASRASDDEEEEEGGAEEEREYTDEDSEDRRRFSAARSRALAGPFSAAYLLGSTTSSLSQLSPARGTKTTGKGKDPARRRFPAQPKKQAQGPPRGRKAKRATAGLGGLAGHFGKEGLRKRNIGVPPEEHEDEEEDREEGSSSAFSEEEDDDDDHDEVARERERGGKNERRAKKALEEQVQKQEEQEEVVNKKLLGRPTAPNRFFASPAPSSPVPVVYHDNEEARIAGRVVKSSGKSSHRKIVEPAEGYSQKNHISSSTPDAPSPSNGHSVSGWPHECEPQEDANSTSAAQYYRPRKAPLLNETDLNSMPKSSVLRRRLGNTVGCDVGASAAAYNSGNGPTKTQKKKKKKKSRSKSKTPPPAAHNSAVVRKFRNDRKDVYHKDFNRRSAERSDRRNDNTYNSSGQLSAAPSQRYADPSARHPIDNEGKEEMAHTKRNPHAPGAQQDSSARRWLHRRAPPAPTTAARRRAKADRVLPSNVLEWATMAGVELGHLVQEKARLYREFLLRPKMHRALWEKACTASRRRLQELIPAMVLADEAAMRSRMQSEREGSREGVVQSRGRRTSSRRKGRRLSGSVPRCANLAGNQALRANREYQEWCRWRLERFFDQRSYLNVVWRGLPKHDVAFLLSGRYIIPSSEHIRSDINDYRKFMRRGFALRRLILEEIGLDRIGNPKEPKDVDEEEEDEEEEEEETDNATDGDNEPQVDDEDNISELYDCRLEARKSQTAPPPRNLAMDITFNSSSERLVLRFYVLTVDEMGEDIETYVGKWEAACLENWRWVVLGGPLKNKVLHFDTRGPRENPKKGCHQRRNAGNANSKLTSHNSASAALSSLAFIPAISVTVGGSMCFQRLRRPDANAKHFVCARCGHFFVQSRQQRFEVDAPKRRCWICTRRTDLIPVSATYESEKNDFLRSLLAPLQQAYDDAVGRPRAGRILPEKMIRQRIKEMVEQTRYELEHRPLWRSADSHCC